jgi:hypothetical protein
LTKGAKAEGGEGQQGSVGDGKTLFLRWRNPLQILIMFLS